MDKATIQGVKLVDVRPSDVFDLANLTLAELVRIKVHLGLNTPRQVPAKVTDKKPADVLVGEIVYLPLNFIFNSC